MIRNYLDILSEIIRDYWNEPALTDYSLLEGGEGKDYTYGLLQQAIDELKERFCQMGLQPRDHIAICGGNCVNWVVAYLAIAQFGAVSVPIMDSLDEEEQDQLMAFADCRAKIMVRPCAITLSSLPMAHPRAIAPSSLAQICFTSGSSQQPKAVMLSMECISNNVHIAINTIPKHNNRNFVSMLPLYHTYGLVGEILCQVGQGKHIFILGSNLSPSRIKQAIVSLRPYAIVTVPVIINIFFRYFKDELSTIFGNNLQQLLVGGSPLNALIEDKLLQLHIPLTVGYGLTEMGTLVGASLWFSYKPHSCGHLVINTEAKIVDGEIWVRGANVMLGYYKDEEATREKIDKDGWLHTGDAGYIDEDGYLFVKGRLNQDMIVLPNGENISPLHIEGLLNQVEGVNESLVLAREGQLVALVYVAVPLDRKDLLRTINPQLPLYSQLYDIEFVSEPFAKTPKQTIKRYLYH